VIPHTEWQVQNTLSLGAANQPLSDSIVCLADPECRGDLQVMPSMKMIGTGRLGRSRSPKNQRLAFKVPPKSCMEDGGRSTLNKVRMHRITPRFCTGLLIPSSGVGFTYIRSPKRYQKPNHFNSPQSIVWVDTRYCPMLLQYLSLELW
jgi:hypothetical protein